jgi:hypothetical protein
MGRPVTNVKEETANVRIANAKIAKTSIYTSLCPTFSNQLLVQLT